MNFKSLTHARVVRDRLAEMLLTDMDQIPNAQDIVKSICRAEHGCETRWHGAGLPLLIELNPHYCEMIRQRTNVTPGLELA